jgi:hypothetical protein
MKELHYVGDCANGQTDLISNVGSAIDDTGADTGAVGELPGFVINLKKWTKDRQ